jgi:hypothetical protein
MVVSFKKVTTAPRTFNIETENLKFFGEFSYFNKNLVKLSGKIIGDIPLECSRCLDVEKVSQNIDLEMLLSDGLYKQADHSPELDIIEFEDGQIDFDYILNSEIESIQSDYFLCSKCKKTDDFEVEY